jgi:hypothetical protein
MATLSNLKSEAKAFIKRKIGPDEVIRILPEQAPENSSPSYVLYTAFDENPDCLGKILFDVNGYWIYDGEILSISEQEQIAKFIINYVEPL